MAAPALVNAGVYTFSTASGATESGGSAVNASGTFTTGAGTLTITLNNNLAAGDVKNVAQNISDVYFTLSDSTAGSVGSSSASFINVDSSGNATSASVSGTDQMGWSLSNVGNVWHLDGLTGSSTPAHTIIGGSGSTYANANNSIAGNNPHNPFAQGSATWTLNMAGVTSNTAVSGVTFSFGTAAGNNVPTPEPATLAVLGVGAVALLRRRKAAK